MLAWFPELYEDELLYSAIARYSDVVRYRTESAVGLEIFGVKRIAPDFPTRLNRLISILPPSHPYTPDNLVDNHTLFPYYSFPLEQSEAQKVREKMLSDSRHKPYNKLGLTTARVSAPSYFRFCSICVVEDRLSRGETYWHRSHQLAGLGVCPTHAVWLEDSEVVFRIPGKPLTRYISAESSIRITEPRFMDLSKPENNTLLEFAEDASWILQHSGSLKGGADTRSRYRSILAEQNLASYDQRVNFTQLTDAFKSFCAQNSFPWFNKDTFQPKYHFLQRLINDERFVISAIDHLIFIRFLGFRAREFFNYQPSLAPFGKGPWPCLNPICKHYHKLSISQCEIKYRIRGKPHRRIIGIFKCECGYTYYRIGPDSLPEDSYRFVGVISYGPLWENTFSSMWNNAENVTLKEIARKFHMNTETAKKHAKRLSLPPRKGTSLVLEIVQSSANDAFDDNPSEKLEQYRIAWLSMRERYPEASRSQLHAMMKKEVSFLKWHDRVWLEQHSPRSLRGKKPSTAKWMRMDIEFAARLPDAHNKLLKGRKRVTRNALLREIGAKYWITRTNRTNRFPQTTRIATELTETPIEYSLRRIEMAVAECKKLGLQLSEYWLVRKAGVVHHYYSDIPVIKEALARALKEHE